MNDTPISAADRHRKATELLPWYVNGTLGADETAWIEAHLAQCPECQKELAFERGMHANLPESAPLPDADAGWAAMLERMQEAPVPVPADEPAAPSGHGNVVALRPRTFLRRPIPLGWAMAAQAAAIVLMVGGSQLGLVRSSGEHEYHALASPSQTGAANMLVMFQPDLREADLRRILLSNRAELIGGPNASGAYQLRFAPGTLTGAMTRLRADPRVTMAQPIDGDGR